MRRGLQAEVLASLGLVMVTATGVLGALVVATHEAQLRPLRGLAARTLVDEARLPVALRDRDGPSIHWWVVGPAGGAEPRGAHRVPLPDDARALVDEARGGGRPLLRAGPPWRDVLFAAPLARNGDVAVAVVPATVSAGWALAILLASVAVFTGFGATLLRQRIVRPLQRVGETARAIADGAAGARVLEDGVRETAELARAFNDMTEALERRSEALSKAVVDLRESNRDLRQARAGLDRAERLAAVGRLAAGVAHEVGNPMGAVLAFLALAGGDGTLSDTTRGHLARASREGERVRGILRQLLDFSRPPRRERRPVDLVGLAQETSELVQAQRRYAGIEIEVVAEADPPPAAADAGGVGQILLNLLLNAADAVRGAPHAKIRVVVGPAARDGRRGDEPGAAAERRCPDAVDCRVEDNGPGVASEDRERIFDPFFTTKAPGEGTGLGLSNAARFADEFGGSLALDPEHRPGAAFVLRLPAAFPEPGAVADTRRRD